MKKTTKPCNSSHTITTARRTDNIPLICTSAGPIHPVHSQPMLLATKAMPETRLHFCHFPAVLQGIKKLVGARARQLVVPIHAHRSRQLTSVQGIRSDRQGDCRNAQRAGSYYLSHPHQFSDQTHQGLDSSI